MVTNLGLIWLQWKWLSACGFEQYSEYMEKLLPLTMVFIWG